MQALYMQNWVFFSMLSILVCQVVIAAVATSSREVPSFQAGGRRMLGRNVWGVGYCNDVSCYIPFARMISEGGYEVERSMGRMMRMSFKPEIAEMIIGDVVGFIQREK